MKLLHAVAAVVALLTFALLLFDRFASDEVRTVAVHWPGRSVQAYLEGPEGRRFPVGEDGRVQLPRSLHDHWLLPVDPQSPADVRPEPLLLDLSVADRMPSLAVR